VGEAVKENERRKATRILGDKLPELLRSFKVDLGTGELLNSITADANRTGISLLVPIHIYKIKNYNIILHSMDGSFSIKDEIVYIKGISPEESRISIMFSPSPNLERYYDLLDSLDK
jgi:hypothetical protein